VFRLAAEQVFEKEKRPQWLLKLLEELKLLLGKEKHQRTMLIETRHEIGKRIIEEQKKPHFYDTFESIPIYMRTLSKELGISEGELYAYTKLVEKFPDLKELYGMYSDVREHQMSWHNIEHEILYPSKEKKLEKEVEENRKLCELEEILSDLAQLVFVKKNQMLNCDACRMKEECATIKPKLLLFGEKYLGD